MLFMKNPFDHLTCCHKIPPHLLLCSLHTAYYAQLRRLQLPRPQLPRPRPGAAARRAPARHRFVVRVSYPDARHQLWRVAHGPEVAAHVVATGLARRARLGRRGPIEH